MAIPYNCAYCRSYKWIPKYNLQRTKPKPVLSQLRWLPATLKCSHMLPDIISPIMQASSPISEETRRHATAVASHPHFKITEKKKKNLSFNWLQLVWIMRCGCQISGKLPVWSLTSQILGPLTNRIINTILNNVNINEILNLGLGDGMKQSMNQNPSCSMCCL